MGKRSTGLGGHVDRGGKPRSTVSLDDRFEGPQRHAASELMEISFTLPGNKIHMSDIPTDFFNGSWDVELADKKFGSDVTVPKHANVSAICVVTFP